MLGADGPGESLWISHCYRIRLYMDQGVRLNGARVSGLAIDIAYWHIKYFCANVGFRRILSELMCRTGGWFVI